MLAVLMNTALNWMLCNRRDTGCRAWLKQVPARAPGVRRPNGCESPTRGIPIRIGGMNYATVAFMRFGRPHVNGVGRR